MSAYPHLAARIFNVPLLVHPQKLDAIIAGLGQRLLGGQPLYQYGSRTDSTSLGMAMTRILLPLYQHGSNTDSAALPAELFTTRKGPRAERGYQVVDGVAVLNVSGALVHKTRIEADSSTLLGYNSIAADLIDAMDNPDAHAVLQIWDSPGGEAQGAFQYADTARAMRGKKPFIALADGMAASAGYLGASAASELAITDTGYAGSIGVVMRHIDMSVAMANEGLRVEHIFAGAKKIDGNSFEPLSAAVRADFQAEIDSLYTTFIASVAQARSLSPEAIRATQAATYRGQDAIRAGLADRMATADALITELAANRSRTYAVGPNTRSFTADTGATMSHSTQGGQPTATQTHPTATQPPASTAAPSASNPAMTTFTQADLDAAVAAASVTAATQERARLSAIQSHPNAGTQPGLVKLCIDTGLSAEQAAAVLGAVVSAPASAANNFAAAMAATKNPAVSGIEAPATAGALDPEAQAAALAASVLACYRISA